VNGLAIVRVQGNARGTSTNNTSISVTLSHAPANGNLLVATIECAGSSTNPTVSSISQTRVTWTRQQGYNSNDAPDTEIWAGVVSSGASNSITINLTGGTGGTYMNVANISEYSGLLASGFLDQTTTNSSGSGKSASADTGTTVTTTQPSELWIGTVTAYDSSSRACGMSSPTNGFTLLDGANFANGVYNVSNAYLEKIVSTTGTANSGATVATSTYWTGCIATFKTSATPTPPPSDPCAALQAALDALSPGDFLTEAEYEQALRYFTAQLRACRRKYGYP